MAISARLRKAIDIGTIKEMMPALRAAQHELIPLKAQIREIEQLMARARGMMDPSGFWVPRPPLRTPPRPPTLHEAIADVLARHENGWMRCSDIARAIARRGLYGRRDGLPPTTNDISARISAYRGLFERSGELVRLRIPPPGCPRKDMSKPARPTYPHP